MTVNPRLDHLIWENCFLSLPWDIAAIWSQNRNDKNSTTSNLKDASSELVEITLAIHSDEEDNQPQHRIKCFQRQPGTVLGCGARVAVLYRDVTWCSTPLPALELLSCSRDHRAASSHDRPLIREKAGGGWGRRRPQAFVMNIIILYIQLYIASLLPLWSPAHTKFYPLTTRWERSHRDRSSTSHLQWISCRSRYFKDREEAQKKKNNQPSDRPITS